MLDNKDKFELKFWAVLVVILIVAFGFFETIKALLFTLGVFALALIVFIVPVFAIGILYELWQESRETKVSFFKITKEYVSGLIN